MTRSFNSKILCPKCGHIHTEETSLERWIRNNPKLDSQSAGVVRFDIDILLHRYLMLKDKRGYRDIQCMMFIEAKTLGAKLSDSQHDTLLLLNQVLRNRRPNMHSRKRGFHLKNHKPLKNAYSYLLGRDITLRLFGGHFLQLEGLCPDSSKWMKWDGRAIDKDTLEKLLLFELNPDNLESFDWRRRYSDFNSGNLPFDKEQDDAS